MSFNITVKPWSSLLVGLLFTACNVSAGVTAPGVPNAGNLLQEIKPDRGLPSAKEPALTIEPQKQGGLPDTTPFSVSRVDIQGNTLLDTASLHALVADAEGKELTLAQLNAFAARITNYYHSHGYPLARAYIPAQTIADGIVRINVIEAHYGDIRLNNNSRVSDRLLNTTLSPLQSGGVIEQVSLDRSLLLLSDIPGIVVNANLAPGIEVGSSDLAVNAEADSILSGYIHLDDFGNRYTGSRARVGATINLNNPLHLGDVLSASFITEGSDLNYGRISYEALLNGRGTRLGAGYSALDYNLTGDLSSLDAHGNAQTASLWLRHPLLRSRDVNLYGQVEYDYLQLEDDIDISSIRYHRHINDWTISLYGDLRDTLLSGGINTYSLRYTTGQVDFDNDLAEAADAATVQTRGNFGRWNAGLSRLQRVNDDNALYLTVNGQWADSNLDPAEKMVVGGPYSVRAYDVAALSGDSGYFVSGEWRYTLPIHVGGQWQAIGFVETAHVTINHDSVGNGPNDATLSGAGIGINWIGRNQWTAKANIATPIGGGEPSLISDDESVRAWVVIGKEF